MIEKDMKPLKMKLVDPEQITEAMVTTVRNSVWFDGSREFATMLVRDMHAALGKLGVVMVQPDVDDAS